MRKVALAGAAAVLAFSISSGADSSFAKGKRNSGYDGDTRHCVTGREVWIVGKPIRKERLERRWEVKGRGENVIIPGVGNSWVYKMCDGEPRFAFASFNSRGNLSGVGVIKPEVRPVLPAPEEIPDTPPVVISLPPQDIP